MLTINMSKILGDESYKEAISKCQDEWNSANNTIELLDSFFGASQIYMLPAEIWEKAKIFARESQPIFAEKKKILQTFVKPAYFQFCYNFPFYIDCPIRKDINWFPKEDVFEVSHKEAENFFFTFPHRSLDLIWKHYLEYLTSPPPKVIFEKYKRMKELYKEMVEVEENVEKWYEVLKKVGHDEIVIEHNLEYRLGLDLSNKKLWKIYLNFLEERNLGKFFQGLAKYCRFFLDDDEMKVKYNQAAIKYEYFIPENDFIPGEPEGISPEEIWDDDFNYMEISITHSTHFFNTHNMAFQNFPFQRPFINYIIKSANGKVLQKLYKTCKLFYSIFPAQICYKFDFDIWRSAKRPYFQEESLFIARDLPKNDLHRLIILNWFHFSREKNSDKDLSKMIIPRIYKFEAKYIQICGEKLKSEEFEVLVGHGNVIFLELSDVEISDSKTGEIFDAADILKFTPKIEFISLQDINYGIKTTQKLLEIPFQNNIQDIFATFLAQEIEPLEFAKFLMKSISPTCYIMFGFQTESDDICNHFCNTINECIDQHWNGNYKPNFTWFE